MLNYGQGAYAIFWETAKYAEQSFNVYLKRITKSEKTGHGSFLASTTSQEYCRSLISLVYILALWKWLCTNFKPLSSHFSNNHVYFSNSRSKAILHFLSWPTIIKVLPQNWKFYSFPENFFFLSKGHLNVQLPFPQWNLQ